MQLVANPECDADQLKLTVPCRVNVAVLMPTARAAESRSGPPELPWLMAASVCWKAYKSEWQAIHKGSTAQTCPTRQLLKSWRQSLMLLAAIANGKFKVSIVQSSGPFTTLLTHSYGKPLHLGLLFKSDQPNQAWPNNILLSKTRRSLWRVAIQSKK